MTDSFDEVQFPTNISYGAVGGPEFSTTVIITASGSEARNQNWRNGRVSWDVSTAIQRRSDIRQVIAFFRARRGRARAFRFKDWTDYKAEAEPIGTGDGNGTQFQLRRTYDDGLLQTVRMITKPVAGTVRLYVDSVETAAFTVDTTTGVVTLDSAPAEGALIEADFEFDIPARFDVDKLNVRMEAAEGFIGDQITITEVLGEGVTEAGELGATTGNPLN